MELQPLLRRIEDQQDKINDQEQRLQDLNRKFKLSEEQVRLQKRMLLELHVENRRLERLLGYKAAPSGPALANLVKDDKAVFRLLRNPS